MKDYYEIGSTPANEECAQVGTENYNQRAMVECTAFKNQIRRVLGEEPVGSYLKIKGFPHDFGTYLEVIYVYDDENEDHLAYFHKLDAECPNDWDNEAKVELNIFPVSKKIEKNKIKFVKDLLDFWNEDTCFLSANNIEHPVVEVIKKIAIQNEKEVISTILKYAKKHKDWSFLIIMTIIPENKFPRYPVEYAGNLNELLKIWIKWGKENQYI